MSRTLPLGNGSLPVVVQEALALADRIEEKYPDWMEREEAQNALVHLAEFVRRIPSGDLGIESEPAFLASRQRERVRVNGGPGKHETGGHA